MLGRRIVVFGQSGSGKTTLSRRIGEALALPVIELDSIYHQPKWQPTPVEQFRAKVFALLDQYERGWVCDGNYGALRRDLMQRADTVVWLRLPFRIVYPRLLRRTITRSWRNEELWNTNRESFRLSFLSRDSILLWGITHWRAHIRHVGRDIAECAGHARVLVLRSDRETAELLRAVRESQPRPGAH
jgi:adenylate kinase family enzyme